MGVWNWTHTFDSGDFMTDLKNRKPILALDFDGVCHSYTSGWKGAAVIPDPPVLGLFQFLERAVLDFEVNIWSSRSNQDGGIQAMKSWFFHYCPPEYVALGVLDELRFPTEKPPAFVGLDDRVIQFQGEWPSINFLKNFKPWNQKEV
jgi:hypothetical protein